MIKSNGPQLMGSLLIITIIIILVKPSPRLD